MGRVAEADERTIDVDGVATAYRDVGSGDPVLLLHGSGPGVSGATAWAAVMPKLVDEFRVIVPDLLGFGHSIDTNRQRYGRRAWLQHLLAFVEQLGLKRFSIVATSMGSALALGAARQRPDAVASMVLAGSMGLEMPLTPALDELWGYRPSPEAARRALNSLAYDHSLVTDEAVEARYRASMEPDARTCYERMFPPPRQRWVNDLALPVTELEQVRQPVLLIHGLEDSIIPLHLSSLRLVEILPRAELHIFGRCRHWPMVEHRDAFVQLTANFISR